MVQQVVSRSQRRLERKQAVVLLGVALGIALVSFSLGVMVGRGGSGSAPPREAAVEPAPAPAPVPAAPAAPAAPVAPQTAPPAAETAGDEPVRADGQATFYDTLPRGEQPMGSGINLPPGEEQAAPAGEPQPAAAEVRTAAPVVKPAAPSPAKAAVSGFVLQVASFRDLDSAESLRQKLAAKGYPLFVEPADLGSKGTWYRVYVGPVATKEAAETHARKLQEQEKINPLLRKR